MNPMKKPTSTPGPGSSGGSFLPTDYIDVPFTPFVVIAGGRKVLIDTGLGDFGGPNAGKLLENLRAAGVPASDIVAVVRDAAKAESLAADGVVVRVAPYEDPDALAAALTGVDRLLLVSSPTIGQRTAQHTNVISAAAAAIRLPTLILKLPSFENVLRRPSAAVEGM